MYCSRDSDEPDYVGRHNADDIIEGYAVRRRSDVSGLVIRSISGASCSLPGGVRVLLEAGYIDN